MKRVFYAILALATLTLASCEKDPIGGTATEKMAGQWYVQLVAVDDQGELLYSDEDLFDLGFFHVLTFNTADNTPDSLWIANVEDFKGVGLPHLNYQVKAGCNLNSNTFGVENGVNLYSGAGVKISNGKILYGAAKTPSGMPADSIVYDLSIEGDPYAAFYGSLRVSGYRYTGLVNDD